MANLLGLLFDRCSSLHRNTKGSDITCVPANEPFRDQDDTSKVQANDLEVNDPSLRYLPVQIDYLRNSKGRLGYFSLPGEVRNNIMQYSLVPGQINLCGISSYTPKSPTEKAWGGILDMVIQILKDIDIPWAANLSDSLPWLLQLLPRYLCQFFPETYVEIRLGIYAAEVCAYILDYLYDWGLRRSLRQISWREFPEPIMEYLYEQVRRRRSTQASAYDSCPIPQLLATCKQAYVEGHIWFYTCNMFFLPRGPVWITQQYFGVLQEQHRSVIRTIGIRFGLEDLTAEDLDILEALPYSGPPHITGSLESWSSCLVGRAMQAWTGKLVFVRSFTTLKHVRLETAYATVDLDGSTLGQSLKGIRSNQTLGYLGTVDLGHESAREVRNLLLQAYTELRNLLSQRIRQYGWISTRTWLRRGTDGQI